jgi:hypothetical protein
MGDSRVYPSLSGTKLKVILLFLLLLHKGGSPAEFGQAHDAH